MKCSLVSVLLYLFLTIFMVEKADTQQYVEVCTLLLCSCSTVTITLHVAWYDDCRWFLDLTSELCGVMLFEVCMLCFIVTFHVTTFDKGNRLVADKTHRFCAPQRQHKCILVSPLCLKFAIFGINFSFFVRIRARHDFRLLRNRSQIDLSALFDTHNLRDPQSSWPTLSE